MCVRLHRHRWHAPSMARASLPELSRRRRSLLRLLLLLLLARPLALPETAGDAVGERGEHAARQQHQQPRGARDLREQQRAALVEHVHGLVGVKTVACSERRPPTPTWSPGGEEGLVRAHASITSWQSQHVLGSCTVHGNNTSVTRMFTLTNPSWCSAGLCVHSCRQGHWQLATVSHTHSTPRPHTQQVLDLPADTRMAAPARRAAYLATTGPAAHRCRRHPPVSHHCVPHVKPCRGLAVAVASHSAAAAVPAPGGDDAAKAGYAATVLSLVNVIMGAGAVSIPFAVK